MDKDWKEEAPAVFSARARKPEEQEEQKEQKEPEKMLPPVQDADWKLPEEPPLLEGDSPLQKEKLPPPRRGNSLATALAVLFLAGAAFGAVLSGQLTGEPAGALARMTQGFLTGRAEGSFREIFFRSFTSSALLAGAVFLSGFSAVGQPFALFFLLFRGVGLGMSMGYFYGSGGGVLTAVLLILPAGALSGYAMLLACREALRLSGRFFRAMVRSESLAAGTFRRYLLKFLIILVLLAAAALLDGGLSKLFLLIGGK